MLGLEEYGMSSSQSLTAGLRAQRLVDDAALRTARARQGAQFANARAANRASEARDATSALMLVQADAEVLRDENRALRAENAEYMAYIEQLLAIVKGQRQAA